MVSALLVGAVCLVSAAAPEDLAAYRSAQSQAGRNADAQIKLALWCEAHGLKTERLRHLALAVLTA